MPVSVVVGGQFGSEGKGKVAYRLAKRDSAAAVVRVGGSNSGHTAIASDGRREVLRQLPTAALLDQTACVLGPGSYIDVQVLLEEIERLKVEPERLHIDPRALIITAADREAERATDLQNRIGSTGSGTGAAVQRRVARSHDSKTYLAANCRALRSYISETTPLLRSMLEADERVIVEGSQGFGLSVLHSPYYPYATSRDTTAAAAVAEAGLSPMDVDHVVLVIRAFPIRVGGNSGPLPNEIDWETIGREGHHAHELAEFTSVTGKLRRVGRFDPEIVKRAIAANAPTEIALNHVDYVDAHTTTDGFLAAAARQFIGRVEEEIGAPITYVGVGPDSLLKYDQAIVENVRRIA